MVEDNAHNRYLATYLLEQRGYRVAAMIDGTNAVAIASVLNPVGILIDIRLPGPDGYTVARALRNESHLSAVPIIAVTSYAMVGDREKALAAGCNGYIEKPFDPETFVTDVETILSRRTTAYS